MTLVERIRRWFGRATTRSDRARAADPADLRPGSEAPADPGAHSGLARPLSDAGPIADPPVGDPPPAGLTDRPLG